MSPVHIESNLPKSHRQLLVVLICLAVVTAIATHTLTAHASQTIRDRIQQRQGGSANEISGSIQVGRLTRTYLLYAPSKYRDGRPNAAVPLVLALHGGGGQGRSMNRLASFDALAEQERFIVAYPDGIDKHWNDGRSTVRNKVDDVAFFRTLIDRLVRDYPIDRKRIFVTGISNGGLMAQRLACEMSDTFAAVASVASALPRDIEPLCRPAQPVSVLMLNGVADPIVPYRGGSIRDFGGSGYGGVVLSSDETLKVWASRDGCQREPETAMLPHKLPEDATRVRRSGYTECKSGSSVVLYAIEGGGHTWPGGWQYFPETVIGKTTRDINATQVIWEFFKQHPKR